MSEVTRGKNTRPLERSRNTPGRLLIFIVAYNAEKTIESVLKRIPESLLSTCEVEVLIIDDSSQDNTFAKSELVKRAGIVPFNITVLFNPVNQGYGGNQKIGFHYAIKNKFDWVALVHGDGQYAPECLPELVEVLANKEADAVFGSRMMEGTSALKGGMPLYKFIGNKILTNFQNFLLKAKLSEFHSGYRLYTTAALARVPFDLNSNDFHFDTEIIIQFVIARLKIKEKPIPTFYGDEICHVNGLKYAWDVCRTTLHAKIQKFHLLYDRKFDCLPLENEYQPALEPHSVESLFLQEIHEKATIHIMGRVSDTFLKILKEKGCKVSVEQKGLLSSQLEGCEGIDYMLLLDDTAISQKPEVCVEQLRFISRFSPDLKIILATGNIGFIITRCLLMLGRFSYTRRGIISFESSRFFTLRSLKKLFTQSWFEYMGVQGVPIQYTRVFKSKWLASIFSILHRVTIKIRPSLFSYQFLVTVTPKPSLEYLLESAVKVAEEKSTKIVPGHKNILSL